MSAVLRPPFYVVFFVLFLRFLTFNFLSIRPIFIRVNRWSVLVSGLNYKL